MEENNLDLLSNLPQDILRKITSFLPLSEAVRTSLLSPQWKSLWCPMKLKFVARDDDIVEGSLQAINTCLGSYDCPDIWNLCSRYPRMVDGDELTVVATKGVRKELHLQFSGGGEIKMGKESSYNLKMERAAGLTTRLSNLGTLETLHLRSISPLAKGLVSSLLANCDRLQNLTVEECQGLKSVEVDKRNHNLRSLTVRGCPDLGNIAVSAPGLRCFSYRGTLTGIQLANTSNLIEVLLDFQGGESVVGFDCEEILSLLASIKDVEILTISGWLLEWLCSAGVIYKSLEFQFSRLKELRWIDDTMNSTKRDSLACFLNICPLLHNLIITVDKNRVGVPCPLFHQYWHEPHLWKDYATMKADVYPQKHLTSVEFSGLTADNEDELSLIGLLHKKAIFIESMTVRSAEDTHKKLWRVVNVVERRRSLWAWWKSWKQDEVLPPRKFCLELVAES